MEGEEQDLYYRDENYDKRLGWKEIVVQAGEGVSLLKSTVPQRDRSDELRVYPKDMLNSPPNQREARSTFVFSGLSRSDEAGPVPTTTQNESKSKDVLASLLAAEKLSLPVIVLSLMVAMGLGALHAISPGHGKTIMAAYLVGTRGTAKHTAFLGFTVTISHTVGVLALGLVVLYTSRFIAPEQLYPWLGLTSGAVIIAIGAWLLISCLRRKQEAFGAHHSHSDVATQLHYAHSHHRAHPRQVSHDNRRLRITWKSLTALGIVGGLLPSVSALIVLLAAISLHRIGFGLLLIVAFSAGMAGVLAGGGLLLVYAGKVIERVRFQNRLTSALSRFLPLAAALVVLVSDVVVAMRAAFQVGLL